MVNKHNRARKDKVMTPEHIEWERFTDLLRGPEGCNFQKKNDPWRCLGGMDKSLANSILIRFFPNVDVHLSDEYFDQNGGHCDCEILWNVDL